MYMNLSIEEIHFVMASDLQAVNKTLSMVKKSDLVCCISHRRRYRTLVEGIQKFDCGFSLYLM